MNYHILNIFILFYFLLEREREKREEEREEERETFSFINQLTSWQGEIKDNISK